MHRIPALDVQASLAICRR